MRYKIIFYFDGKIHKLSEISKQLTIYYSWEGILKKMEINNNEEIKILDDVFLEADKRYYAYLIKKFKEKKIEKILNKLLNNANIKSFCDICVKESTENKKYSSQLTNFLKQKFTNKKEKIK